MKEIHIPNGVTSIGINAFAKLYALESLTIPDSVTSIGSNAFASIALRSTYNKMKNLLKTITIPDGVTVLESNVLSSTGLETINLPSNLLTIEDDAFNGNHYLENLVLPNTVKTIGNVY